MHVNYTCKKNRLKITECDSLKPDWRKRLQLILKSEYKIVHKVKAINKYVVSILVHSLATTIRPSAPMAS